MARLVFSLVLWDFGFKITGLGLKFDEKIVVSWLLILDVAAWSYGASTDFGKVSGPGGMLLLAALSKLGRG